MSPELCIEPCSLVVAKLALELVADVVLAQRPNGESDSVANSRVELCGKALEFVVGADVDPDARTLHADQHTPIDEVGPMATSGVGANRLAGVVGPSAVAERADRYRANGRTQE
jgi:hypothetical protein